MARAEALALTPALLRDWPLPLPEDGDDKHARGTVLVVGGAVSTPGAVLLAGLASLRVGAGRLQVATVPETAVPLAVALPEAMVTGGLLASCDVSGADCVVLGPGLLDGNDARALLSGLLPRVEDRPLVIDALCLTALTEHDRLPAATVLTPNRGELQSLVGDGRVDDLAVLCAARFGAVVATHGWVAAPDGRLWRNDAGSVGLATSGSGDVLAGSIAGLLARGAGPAQAACWGQYLHAAAADLLATSHGRLGFLARELLDALPPALLSLTA